MTVRQWKLMQRLTNGEKCRAGFNEDWWQRLLMMMRATQSHQQRSYRAKKENSNPITFNRTCPNGIAGVEERLTECLGQEPYLQELEQELRKTKDGGEKKVQDSPESFAVEHNTKDVQISTQDDNDETKTLQVSRGSQPRSCQQVPSVEAAVSLEYKEQLTRQIEDLQAFKAAYIGRNEGETPNVQ